MHTVRADKGLMEPMSGILQENVSCGAQMVISRSADDRHRFIVICFLLLDLHRVSDLKEVTLWSLG